MVRNTDQKVSCAGLRNTAVAGSMTRPVPICMNIASAPIVRSLRRLARSGFPTETVSASIASTVFSVVSTGPIVNDMFE